MDQQLNQTVVVLSKIVLETQATLQSVLAIVEEQGRELAEAFQAHFNETLAARRESLAFKVEDLNPGLAALLFQQPPE